MNFASDNTAGVAPEIMTALSQANEGFTLGYGNDDWTRRVEKKFCELFERDVAVFLVSTGTAANALSLSVLCPPWGAVLCHADSHIENDECGAPEFYTGGAKLVHVSGARALIDPEALRVASRLNRGDVHCVQPSVVSITQASELGTLYSLAHTSAIGEVCREAGLGLHMDGSRFANAVAALGASPAELTWKAGVDILSFGATKNGALGVEAIVLFDKKWADELGFRRKRGGHLSSKMRFLAAQMDAYLADDLWLANARAANGAAARLDAGLRAIPGVEVEGAVEANMLFVRLPQAMIDGLLAQGFRFYTDRWGPGVVRLVTSFLTTADDVDRLLEAARKLA